MPCVILMTVLRIMKPRSDSIRRIADREEAIGCASSDYNRGDDAPDPEIDDDNRPVSNKANDVGEDENVVR